ncbi:MAG TPA: OmpA family protein [Prolixibacteraceae bacterium]|nr:OmpA family protein [Prolixibacteraceae bacterium]
MKVFPILFVVLFCLCAINVEAQINLKDKLKNQTNNRANNKVDQGIDKGMDALEGGVKGVFKKKDKADEATKQAEEAVEEATDEATEEASEETSGEAKPDNVKAPSLQAYSKFDFVPGEKVIFYEDFSQDAVGDFPALWNTNGSAEVVTTNLFPGQWMKFSGDGAIWTDALLDLPENYTIEFDVIPVPGENGEMSGYDFRLIQSINVKAYDHGAVPGKNGFLFVMEYYGRPGYRTYMNSEEGNELGLSGVKEGEQFKQKVNQKYRMAIWVQKSRIRVYQNENKLFDLPRAFSLPGVKMDRIRFEEGAAMVSNIRIAIGAPDMRSKLLTEGKLVSYGIYFDVNKDVVKPESYATLKTIADVLNENPQVRINIDGYTDSDGSDEANLDLSKRRSASVKNELVKNFGIDGSRIEAGGQGETKPVAPNDTPANKALNRRVEFIKL